MKKIAFATLFSLVCTLPLFAQTKKEKIEELVFINAQTGNKMLDGMWNMFDQIPLPGDKKKNTASTDTRIKPLVKDALPLQDEQAFEDTAQYNKRQRIKAAFKVIMTDYMAEMKNQLVSLYDSAFNEAQIGKQLTYTKSSACKKMTASSVDMFAKGNPMEALKDTSYRTYKFNPKRKAKLDTLFSLMRSKSIIKTYGKEMTSIASSAVASQERDPAERRKMQNGIDSVLKKTLSDSSFAKHMEEEAKATALRSEVSYDKVLNDEELDYLIAYNRDPEVENIKQIQAKITMSVTLKLMPKTTTQIAALFKMAK